MFRLQIRYTYNGQFLPYGQNQEVYKTDCQHTNLVNYRAGYRERPLKCPDSQGKMGVLHQKTAREELHRCFLSALARDVNV